MNENVIIPNDTSPADTTFNWIEQFSNVSNWNIYYNNLQINFDQQMGKISK